jgi:hypothetical protein
MDTVMLRAALAVALASLAMPAGAAVLYKTVDDKGVVMFSDVPPDKGVEAKKLIVPESTAAVPGALRPADVVATAPSRVAETYLGDEVVQRASLQVDMAEHALAVARRPLWEVANPMKLAGPKMTRADQERVDFYQKNLKIAKNQLADLLRSKLRADVRTMTAEAGVPIYGPSSPISRP